MFEKSLKIDPFNFFQLKRIQDYSLPKQLRKYNFREDKGKRIRNQHLNFSSHLFDRRCDKADYFYSIYAVFGKCNSLFFFRYYVFNYTAFIPLLHNTKINYILSRTFFSKTISLILMNICFLECSLSASQIKFAIHT